MKLITIVLAFFIFFVNFSVYSNTPNTLQTSLTIYKNNFAVVNQSLEFNLTTSPATFEITSLPNQFVSSSLLLSFDGELLESSLLWNLKDFNSHLISAIGKDVNVFGPNGFNFKGKLAFISDDGVIISSEDGKSLFISELENYSILATDFRIENLVPKVTYKVKPKKLGKFQANLTYQTFAIKWTGKYTAVLNSAENKMDLVLFAEISNQTNLDFENVSLKLIAGQPFFFARNYQYNSKFLNIQYDALMAQEASPRIATPIEGEDVFEFYQFEFPYSVTLKKNETKYFPLFERKDIPVEKIYNFSFSDYSNFPVKGTPTTYFSFKNTKENNLGLALPSGLIDFYKIGKTTNEFVGQANLTELAKNNVAKLPVAKSFDINIIAQLRDETKLSRNVTQKSFKVELINSKDKDVVCEIEYHFQGDTKLLESNFKLKSKEDGKMIFEVPIKTNSKNELNFKVEIQTIN
ncbi:MAG: DUF4139 domain-containing protein [Ignavibacteria bacterium]|nr:DUF4139 domain-containing protein [Ignavibacteria bacterium]